MSFARHAFHDGTDVYKAIPTTPPPHLRFFCALLAPTGPLGGGALFFSSQLKTRSKR